MKIDPETKKGRRALTIAWLLLRFIRWSLGITLRQTIIEGADTLCSMQMEKRPMVLTYWHDRTFLGSDFIQERLNRKGVHLTLMASRSRDGALVSKLAEGWNIDVVRGSSSKGGAAALRGMVRAVNKGKTSPIVVPDGPRGPKYQYKGGSSTLSQLTSIPVLPMGFAAERCWHLGSWDKMIIPKPFSRTTVVLGEPTVVQRGLSEEESEQQRLALEAAVNEATRKAEAVFGRGFPDLDVHPELAEPRRN